MLLDVSIHRLIMLSRLNTGDNTLFLPPFPLLYPLSCLVYIVAHRPPACNTAVYPPLSDPPPCNLPSCNPPACKLPLCKLSLCKSLPCPAPSSRRHRRATRLTSCSTSLDRSIPTKNRSPVEELCIRQPHETRAMRDGSMTVKGLLVNLIKVELNADCVAMKLRRDLSSE